MSATVVHSYLYGFLSPVLIGCRPDGSMVHYDYTENLEQFIRQLYTGGFVSLLYWNLEDERYREFELLKLAPSAELFDRMLSFLVQLPDIKHLSIANVLTCSETALHMLLNDEITVSFSAEPEPRFVISGLSSPHTHYPYHEHIE